MKVLLLMCRLMILKHGKQVGLRIVIILLFRFGIKKINYTMEMEYIQL
jgi:hypothetical protein